MNESPLKIGYVPSHLFTYFAQEYDVFGRSVKTLEALAREQGFALEVVSEPVSNAVDAIRAQQAMDAAGVDLVLLQSSSFAMGDVVSAFAAGKARIGLWAVEEPTHQGPVLLNNFVSLNMNASILRKYFSPPIRYKWFFGIAEHPWFAPRLAITVKALTALKRLRESRVGWIGGLAPTFYNFTFDPRKLAERLGGQVISHELEELFERMQFSTAEVDHTIEEMTTFARNRVEVSREDVGQNARIFLALRKLAKEQGYAALAVNDWPRFQSKLGIHPGMAFSWLDQAEGIPVASEGDVLGALSMLLMRVISGEGAMLLDFTDIDLDTGSLLTWHCGGSPLNLANKEGIIWKNHSTLGRKNSMVRPVGAVADFRFAPQPVTLTRLSKDANRLLVIEAKVIEGINQGFDGSRGWLQDFHLNHEVTTLADLVNTVLVEGIEHHFILGSGLHAEVFSEIAAWTGMSVIERVPYRNFLQFA